MKGIIVITPLLSAFKQMEVGRNPTQILQTSVSLVRGPPLRIANWVH